MHTPPLWFHFPPPILFNSSSNLLAHFTPPFQSHHLKFQQSPHPISYRLIFLHIYWAQLQKSLQTQPELFICIYPPPPLQPHTLSPLLISSPPCFGKPFIFHHLPIQCYPTNSTAWCHHEICKLVQACNLSCALLHFLQTIIELITIISKIHRHLSELEFSGLQIGWVKARVKSLTLQYHPIFVQYPKLLPINPAFRYQTSCLRISTAFRVLTLPVCHCLQLP